MVFWIILLNWRNKILVEFSLLDQLVILLFNYSTELQKWITWIFNNLFISKFTELNFIEIFLREYWLKLFNYIYYTHI